LKTNGLNDPTNGSYRVFTPRTRVYLREAQVRKWTKLKRTLCFRRLLRVQLLNPNS